MHTKTSVVRIDTHTGIGATIGLSSSSAAIRFDHEEASTMGNTTTGAKHAPKAKTYDPPNDFDLMSVRQVAVAMGVGERMVRRLVNTGELRSFKIAGKRRVRRDDVTAYLDAQYAAQQRA